MTAVNTDTPKAGAISVTADPKNGIVRGTADINASPERVFRALTTAEMAEWWGHEGVYRTHDYEIDLRPGGKWGCKATGADGSPMSVGGEYITVDPPRVLEYTWKPSWDNFAESRVRIEINADGRGPYRFFYAGDGAEPRHVHVARDDKVAKVWLDPVRLEESGGFSRTEINRIVSLVAEHRRALSRSWNDYFTG